MSNFPAAKEANKQLKAQKALLEGDAGGAGAEPEAGAAASPPAGARWRA